MSLSPKTIQKYSYTSPKGDKYKMTVTQKPIMKTVRTLTKNGETLSPSKLPSPVRRALMQNVLRRSSSGEGGKKGLEGVPTHVLAIMTKDLSIFQVIKQICASSYSMLQNVCMNSTFWTHWIENQTESQRERKMLDWFFQTDPKIFTINKETLKYISVFFVKHPKGLTSIPFTKLLSEYNTKDWLRPLKKNVQFTQNLKDDHHTNAYVFQILGEEVQLHPIDKLLIELYGVAQKNTILEDEGDIEEVISSQPILFNPKPEIQFPMTFLFLHGKPEYFLNDPTISNIMLFDIDFPYTDIDYGSKVYATVNQSKKLSFRDFILNRNELSKVKIDIEFSQLI